MIILSAYHTFISNVCSFFPVAHCVFYLLVCVVCIAYMSRRRIDAYIYLHFTRSSHVFEEHYFDFKSYPKMTIHSIASRTVNFSENYKLQYRLNKYNLKQVTILISDSQKKKKRTGYTCLKSQLILRTWYALVI